MAAGEALSTRKARVQAHLAELLLGDLLQAVLLQKKLSSAALGVFSCFSWVFLPEAGANRRRAAGWPSHVVQ